MVKLWKITVNNWGWDGPRTYYSLNKNLLALFGDMYPAADPVKYAGRFTDENAKKLLWCNAYD